MKYPGMYCHSFSVVSNVQFLPSICARLLAYGKGWCLQVVWDLICFVFWSTPGPCGYILPKKHTYIRGHNWHVSIFWFVLRWNFDGRARPVTFECFERVCFCFRSFMDLCPQCSFGTNSIVKGSCLLVKLEFLLKDNSVSSMEMVHKGKMTPRQVATGPLWWLKVRPAIAVGGGHGYIWWPYFRVIWLIDCDSRVPIMRTWPTNMVILLVNFYFTQQHFHITMNYISWSRMMI